MSVTPLNGFSFRGWYVLFSKPLIVICACGLPNDYVLFSKGNCNPYLDHRTNHILPRPSPLSLPFLITQEPSERRPSHCFSFPKPFENPLKNPFEKPFQPSHFPNPAILTDFASSMKQKLQCVKWLLLGFDILI
ncbi:hypothetical protein Fmac_027011 [Flemingia macrophylla]|uniref:Uncharacterized protein n=1 Tax=Flemingia macrophylla TaxID=520843 RepID=A0ABD1LGG0_9FABA